MTEQTRTPPGEEAFKAQEEDYEEPDDREVQVPCFGSQIELQLCEEMSKPI